MIPKADIRFSVSMCVYNSDNPNWFKAAVESVINQTRKPDEIVLVVDGPVNESLNETIFGFESNSSFKVIRLPENVGHGNARRIGLENCSYEFVALMDADDISLADRFEKQIDIFLKDADLDIVGGQITEFIGESNNIIGKRVVPETDKEIKNYMKKRCPMNQVSVMFKKSSVIEAGGFIDWFCEEDYYLWIRMALKGMKFANVPDILVNCRAGDDLYQRRGGMKYFKSEYKIQKLMLDEKMIDIRRFTLNVTERFIIQVLMPNKVRAWVFKRFARKN